MTEQPHALLYCRISDPKQKHEGHGLESQEHRVRQFAELNGFYVDKVFHDDVTGGGDFSKRPAMTQLLDYLKRNRSRNYVVIFDDIKRFSRDVYFYWGLIRELDKYNAQPMSPNFVFEKTPEGRFQQSITVAAGEYERESNARQTQQKTKARLEAGYHAFIAPTGFKFVKDKVHGKLLVKDEPIASIIAEAMIGYASGRFQTAQEVRYFLENEPLFPKMKSGRIGNSKAKEILTNPLYASMIVYEPWGVSMRKGRHEGMISYQTFCQIQEKLEGRSHAPARKDLSKDFPLRGAVACECGNSLTSGWSKSRSGKLHPYYLCQNRKCQYKGKSIRRDVLEGEFDKLLREITPSTEVFEAASKMFKQLWSHKALSVQVRQQALWEELDAIEKDVESILDRIVDATNDKIVKAYEKRLEKLERQKLFLQEKIEQNSKPERSFEQMYRTAMQFLENPYGLWASERLDGKRNVCKLVFSERLVWDRKGMYRTPQLTLPFKALGGISDQKIRMVPRKGLEPSLPYEN